jgi:capsular exopolysaccharide synthesis family protein
MSRLYLEYVNIVPRTSEPGRLPQTERYLQTQAGLIVSRPIIAAALERLASQRLETLKDVDIPAAFVAKSIRIEVGRRDDIISISFDSPFPVEAAQIVNGTVEAYMASRSRNEQRNAAQVLEILQTDLKRVANDRSQKQGELEVFQTNQMPLALGSEAGGSLMQTRMADLQTELGRAQTTAVEAESFRDGANELRADAGALRQYLYVKGTISGYTSSVPDRASLENRLTEMDIQIGELAHRWTPNHPAITALQDQRTVVQTRLAEMDERFVADVIVSAEQQFREAKAYETRLAALYEEQRRQMLALSAEISQYQRLRSEVDRLAVYAQTLETQVGEIARIVNEDVGQLRMAILESAVPSEKPSAPQKSKIMAMALLLGMLLGGSAAVARDRLDQTLRSADEIAAMLRLPALGVIPVMSHRIKAPARGQKVLLEPDSHEAEAYRSVRTAVFFGAPKGTARIILVTSPGAGDGKSTLVSNLAIAMATAGQRTIIVDADLRKPMQKAIFELGHRERYLEDVLAGRARLAETLSATKVERLNLLACRGGHSNPAEIINSPRFGKLLQHLAGAYDRVLVDAPPVTVVTDAQILSVACDATVLVLRADKTTRKMAKRAVEALQNVGAQILGVVVNQISKNDDRYGYYGRYKHGYTGGSNGEERKAKGLLAKGDGRLSLVGLAKGGR